MCQVPNEKANEEQPRCSSSINDDVYDNEESNEEDHITSSQPGKKNSKRK